MMTRSQLALVAAALVLFSLMMLILFGDKGLADLNMLKKGRDQLVMKNRRVVDENLALYRSIDRLKNDPAYIESVARQELGVIGENELIIQMRRGRP